MPLISLFKFVNWITGTPHAIEDGVSSAFTLPLQQQVVDAMNQAPFLASGPNHRAGFVPDPGAVAGTTKFLREDGTFAVPASPTPAAGTVIGYNAAFNNTHTTGTTVMASGAPDSIPQITDGTQVTSLSFTPQYANSIIHIWYSIDLTLALASNNIWVGVFNGAADAIHAIQMNVAANDGPLSAAGQFSYSPGSTTAITFSMRIGLIVAGNTWAFNGLTTARRLGGAQYASLAVMEVKQ